MNKLLLRFAIILQEYSLDEIARHDGPLFHRWLPDGQKDGINLSTGDKNISLKVWFERWGFVDGGWIRFKLNERKVDAAIIPKQAILDAGPLIGNLEIIGLTDDELKVLKENLIGDESYISLGKRIVNILYPPVSNLIEILRTNYGQHWISKLNKWDSRKESLGNYCSSIQLAWRLNENEPWKKFKPNESQQSIILDIKKDYSEYLNATDWKEIEKVVNEGYMPNLSAYALVRTHQLLDFGSLKYAFIEGVIALELALNEFILNRLKSNKLLIEANQAFWNLPLRSQLITMTSLIVDISQSDIEKAMQAIDIRNKIIHEGWEPSKDTSEKIEGLLKVVAKLVKGPRFRFPTAFPSNEIKPIEEWEKE